mgnify:CR=1 FL=1
MRFFVHEESDMGEKQYYIYSRDVKSITNNVT